MEIYKKKIHLGYILLENISCCCWGLLLLFWLCYMFFFAAFTKHADESRIYSIHSRIGEKETQLSIERYIGLIVSEHLEGIFIASHIDTDTLGILLLYISRNKVCL